MGWGVRDYPAPHDVRHARCTANGCDIAAHEDTFECRAKGCTNDQLCEGCTFTCADCCDEFCEHHTRDINADNNEFALYLCGTCEARRNERTEPNEKKAA